MKQNSLQMFLVSLLSTFLCSATMYAQGIYQGSTRVDKCASNSEGITLQAGGSCTIRATLPTPTDLPSSIKWFASGGIYFKDNGTPVTYITEPYTSDSDLSITIYSKDGVTKEEGFSMFAKGRVQIMFVYKSGFCAPIGFDMYVEGGVGYAADV